MRVFVTGAAGYIGKALVQELLNAGHSVLGLSRSDDGAKALEALGAEVLRGSIDDLDMLKKAATSCDGVAHLAFGHDFTKFAEACQTDRAVIEAIGSALVGTNKPFLVSSGALLLPAGRVATEEDVPGSEGLAGLRGPSEGVLQSFASRGVRTAVMRLAPTNHGAGDKGFMAMIIDAIRKSGEAVYIGDGLNSWPAAHYLDAAVAYRLALEKAEPGSVFHLTAEERIPMKDIIGVMGKKLGLPVVSKSAEDAKNIYGFLAHAIAADHPTSSQKTRSVLGWTPSHPTLLEDLETNMYFS